MELMSCRMVVSRDSLQSSKPSLGWNLHRLCRKAGVGNLLSQYQIVLSNHLPCAYEVLAGGNRTHKSTNLLRVSFRAKKRLQ
jgi:hypothetical protein